MSAPAPAQFLKVNERFGINAAMRWAILSMQSRKTYLDGLIDGKYPTPAAPTEATPTLDREEV
jgi:hypothetical protein